MIPPAWPTWLYGQAVALCALAVGGVCGHGGSRTPCTSVFSVRSRSRRYGWPFPYRVAAPEWRARRQAYARAAGELVGDHPLITAGAAGIPHCRLYGVDMLVDAGRYAEARVALDRQCVQEPASADFAAAAATLSHALSVRGLTARRRDGGVPAPLDATTACQRDPRRHAAPARRPGTASFPSSARMDDWVARLDRHEPVRSGRAGIPAEALPNPSLNTSTEVPQALDIHG